MLIIKLLNVDNLLTTGAGDSIILDSKLPHLRVPLNVVYISSANFWKSPVILDSVWMLSGTRMEPSYPLRSINLWYRGFAKVKETLYDFYFFMIINVIFNW